MSRWPSWAPVPNKPTVSVDVKQQLTNHDSMEKVQRRAATWAMQVYKPTSVFEHFIFEDNLCSPHLFPLTYMPEVFLSLTMSAYPIKIKMHSVGRVVSLKSWAGHRCSQGRRPDSFDYNY